MSVNGCISLFEPTDTSAALFRLGTVILGHIRTLYFLTDMKTWLHFDLFARFCKTMWNTERMLYETDNLVKKKRTVAAVR